MPRHWLMRICATAIQLVVVWFVGFLWCVYDHAGLPEVTQVAGTFFFFPLLVVWASYCVSCVRVFVCLLLFQLQTAKCDIVCMMMWHSMYDDVTLFVCLFLSSNCKPANFCVSYHFSMTLFLDFFFLQMPESLSQLPVLASVAWTGFVTTALTVRLVSVHVCLHTC